MSWSPPLVALKSPLLLHDFVVPRYTAMYRWSNYLETCSIPHQGQSQRRADVLVPSSSRSQVSSTPTRFRGPPLHGYVQVRVRDARMSWSPPLVALKSPLLLHDFVVPRYTAMYRSESETRGCPGPLL